MVQLDKETAKVSTEGTALKNLVKSDGWNIVRQRFLQKVSSLMNLENLPLEALDGVSLLQVIAAKKTAKDILLEFLKDIEGDVEQFDGNKEMMKSFEEIIITRETGN